MRRRLILSTALIALSAVIVLGVPLGIVETRQARGEALAQLQREADAAAANVDDRIEAKLPVRTPQLAALVPAHHGVRVAVPGRPAVLVGGPVTGETLRARSRLTKDVSVTAVAPARELGERVRNTWLLIALLGVGGTAAAIALAGLQARRLARPLERLAATSALLGLGDFSARAGRSGIPEIDAAAAALDTSASRIARLVAREREFSADVSHQLRTPLTALRLRLEELPRLTDPGARREETTAALREADRIEETIHTLLAAARARHDGAPGAVTLGPLVARHLGSWRPAFAAAGRELRAPRGACPPVAGTPGAVGQALDVLIENALRHGAGAVRVELTARDGYGCLGVADEGPGIPAGAEHEIFRRGRSLDAAGTGIGLDLARALTEGVGGRLVLAAARPPRFELRLALAAEPAEEPAVEPAPA